MASPAQITANRANATSSTGPADTSRTRFNGVAHGLTSKQTVIPGESQQDYDRFAATLRKELKPGSAIENVLVDRLIAAAWRLQRFTRVESAFLTNRIDAYLQANPDTDPDVAMANLFIDPAETARMRLFLRYQTTVQREYDKSFKELQAAKTERRKQERQKLALGIHDEPESEPATATEPEIGFASHVAGAVPVLDDIGFASQQPFASHAA
jgi:hypothetical protein